jgi:hypothetical protein
MGTPVPAGRLQFKCSIRQVFHILPSGLRRRAVDALPLQLATTLARSGRFLPKRCSENLSRAGIVSC